MLSKPAAPEDLLLRRSARGDSEAFVDLVESTFEVALRCCHGSRARALATYRLMRDHLDEVGPRTRFWVWFQQISRNLILTESPTPKLEESAFAEQFRVPPARPDRSLLSRLSRLHLSGWLFSLGVSSGVVLNLVFRNLGPDLGREPATSVAQAPAIALVVATLCSFVMGPLLPTRFRGLGWILLFPASVLLSLVLFSLGMDLGSGRWDFDAACLRIFDFANSVDLTAGAIVGAASILLGELILKAKPWVLYHGRTPWRVLASLGMLALPLGYLATMLGPTVVAGWSLDPTIERAVLQLPPRSDPSKILFANYPQLPASYLEHPAIVRAQDYAIAPSDEELEAAREVWLQHVRRSWPKTGSPETTLELAAFPADNTTYDLAQRTFFESARRFEVAVRCHLISPDVDLPDHRFVWNTKTRADWALLADLVARADYLPVTTRLDEKQLWQEFAEVARSLESELSSRDPRRWFWYFQGRTRLNQDARSIRQLVSSLKSDDLSPTSELKLMVQCRQGLGVINSTLNLHIYEIACRRSTAELALRLELKNRQSQGKPKPLSPGDLRPPFNTIAAAHADWLNLEQLWKEMVQRPKP